MLWDIQRSLSQRENTLEWRVVHLKSSQRKQEKAKIHPVINGLTLQDYLPSSTLTCILWQTFMLTQSQQSYLEISLYHNHCGLVYKTLQLIEGICWILPIFFYFQWQPEEGSGTFRQSNSTCKNWNGNGTFVLTSWCCSCTIKNCWKNGYKYSKPRLFVNDVKWISDTYQEDQLILQELYY